CADVLARVGLTDAAKRQVRGYSKGMRQRLGFAQVLLGSPDLVFLDEPTNGLDPEGIHDFYRILREVQAGGTTVVITSHILAEIQDRVDQLVILRNGRVAAQGSLEELRGGARERLSAVVVAQNGQASHVGAALAELEGVDAEVLGERVRATCVPQAKMALLGRITALGSKVVDVTLHDASLEQLFLGYGSKHGAH
ncbi:MAG TPA: ABC transporter ATP-binding protein, partial [Telluria sp.]|nr:ABC transporter ATP-binding protein [Telluria sp.]